jgi:hypothetical protein
LQSANLGWIAYLVKQFTFDDDFSGEGRIPFPSGSHNRRRRECQAFFLHLVSTELEKLLNRCQAEMTKQHKTSALHVVQSILS